MDGLHGRGRLHADLQHEGPRATAELERRSRAVGESFVFPQIEIDAADELPAKDRIREREGVVVRRVSRGNNLADAKLGLGGARSRHDGKARRGARRLALCVWCLARGPSLVPARWRWALGPSSVILAPIGEGVGG